MYLPVSSDKIRAVSVLPVPGGPSKSTARGKIRSGRSLVLRAIRSKVSGCFRGCMRLSSTACLTSSYPAMPSQPDFSSLEDGPKTSAPNFCSLAARSSAGIAPGPPLLCHWSLRSLQGLPLPSKDPWLFVMIDSRSSGIPAVAEAFDAVLQATLYASTAVFTSASLKPSSRKQKSLLGPDFGHVSKRLHRPLSTAWPLSTTKLSSVASLSPCATQPHRHTEACHHTTPLAHQPPGVAFRGPVLVTTKRHGLVTLISQWSYKLRSLCDTPTCIVCTRIALVSCSHAPIAAAITLALTQMKMAHMRLAQV